MDIGFNLFWKSRIISDRPIEELSGRNGRYSSLPTPDYAECKPFEIFGEANFNSNMRRHLPTRSLSLVKNGLVHGQSAALFTLNGFGRADHWSVLPELALNLDAGNYSRFFEKGPMGWRFAANPMLRPTKQYEKGVLIGSRYSFNFFHFICDSLVRVLIADEASEFDGWPLVITPSAPQIVEIARMLCPQREIIVMEADDLIRFETLAVPVSSSYSPDDPNRSDDAVMDVPYLPDLRSKLTKPGKLADDRSILFIKRQFYQTENGAISRTILNQEDVIACIAAQGGEVISPELMTIEAQREAFSGAGIVVAMAGGALANVIFCRPGTTIIMICQNKIVQPAYFGLMFDALGLNFLIVASEPVDGSNPHPSHLSVNVDIGVLRKALDREKLI